MDYEKKYKDALSRAKELCDVADMFTITIHDIITIFPELQENEDERIRKGRIKSVSRIFEGHKLYDTDETREEALAWLEKQGKQKPADKVEPKLHEGDWIISNNKKSIYQVIEVKRGIYVIRDNVDNHVYHIGIEECEKSGRLWSINDAKDGDVLVTLPEKGSEHIEQIFLFKAINNRDYVDNCIEYYGCVYDGVFHKNKTGYMGTTLDTFYPATKEQRDLLFQAMKEDGYEWDSEKKELKKIEVKTLNADKVIEWLKITINERAENYGVYNETRLILPYNSIEDLINDFKEDFGL